jgi:hypothetical protein
MTVFSTGTKSSWMPVSFPKKKGAAVGKTKRGKGTKSLVLIDGQGIPLGSHSDPATGGTPPSEITLLDKALGEIRIPKPGPTDQAQTVDW